MVQMFIHLVKHQQSHALSDLLIRELGSRAVLADVFLAFMPSILEQNDLRLPASAVVLGFGAGGFKLAPVVFLKCARPAAFNPPLGSC
jgi:hypothetical protein